ncbi:cyclic GMP-AMP synthase DncV-like nucleotidyltransferase [Streptomyces sp. CA-249302]|uniref:cyclic GMP-AMP synthase DncV-like nucleotidyltransferase n=1 Tax=Streptomyces sp. CA-249302 TaxID=3240058 RepID=UPI003D8FFA36
MTYSVEQLLSCLLTGMVESMDIPSDMQELAVERYEEVGTWLAEMGGEGWSIYPQGSFRLGTVTRPPTADSEYDIDLVCHLDIAKESTTQKALKNRVGTMLKAYMRAKDEVEDDDGPDECKDSRRCWTLKYPDDGFHMDVLPAIPDEDLPPTGIRLTDRKLRPWQLSNPIGYSDWFRTRSDEMKRKIEKVARDTKADVADVPVWRVRTTLQRLVQVLKLHSAVRFSDDLDNRPPSILVTTLAAKAYDGDEDLLSALLSSLSRMPRYIENRSGQLWVPSPAHPGENFADKWNEYPERRDAFHAWLAEISETLKDAYTLKNAGIHRVAERLTPEFGTAPVQKAALAMGDNMLEKRASGNLHMARGSGLLTGATSLSIPLRDHNFFGSHESKKTSS